MCVGLQSTAELKAKISALKDEQSRLSAWKHELEDTEEKVKSEVETMERQRRQLNADRLKLDQLAQQVRDKSAEIDELVSVGSPLLHSTPNQLCNNNLQ